MFVGEIFFRKEDTSTPETTKPFNPRASCRVCQVFKETHTKTTETIGYCRNSKSEVPGEEGECLKIYEGEERDHPKRCGMFTMRHKDYTPYQNWDEFIRLKQYELDRKKLEEEKKRTEQQEQMLKNQKKQQLLLFLGLQIFTLIGLLPVVTDHGTMEGLKMAFEFYFSEGGLQWLINILTPF